MKHYHVISGLGGGYLPNTNDLFETKRAAQQYALDLKDNWLDGQAQHEYDDYEPRKMSGSARQGGYVFSRNDAYDLGEYIEIYGPCFDDCTQED